MDASTTSALSLQGIELMRSLEEGTLGAHKMIPSRAWLQCYMRWIAIGMNELLEVTIDRNTETVTMNFQELIENSISSNEEVMKLGFTQQQKDDGYIGTVIGLAGSQDAGKWTEHTTIIVGGIKYVDQLRNNAINNSKDIHNNVHILPSTKQKRKHDASIVTEPGNDEHDPIPVVPIHDEKYLYDAAIKDWKGIQSVDTLMVSKVHIGREDLDGEYW